MNPAPGGMRIYTPQLPMGIEAPVIQAFDNASGVGATLVKADHYQAVDLTLHVIYGHLTWMATYEPQGSNPSFVGIGFIYAYEATANNVVFGSSKSAALQNYLTQLASMASANGGAPEQGGQYQTITGKIAAIGWDVTGGQKYWYVTLAGQPQDRQGLLDDLELLQPRRPGTVPAGRGSGRSCRDLATGWQSRHLQPLTNRKRQRAQHAAPDHGDA